MNINTLVSTYPEFFHRLSIKDVLSVERVCKLFKRMVAMNPVYPMLATARTVDVIASKATHLLNRNAINYGLASKHYGSESIRLMFNKYPELVDYVFATRFRDEIQSYINTLNNSLSLSYDITNKGCLDSGVVNNNRPTLNAFIQYKEIPLLSKYILIKRDLINLGKRVGNFGNWVGNWGKFLLKVALVIACYMAVLYFNRQFALLVARYRFA